MEPVILASLIITERYVESFPSKNVLVIRFCSGSINDDGVGSLHKFISILHSSNGVFSIVSVKSWPVSCSFHVCNYLWHCFD